jgi:hypothetical protein
VDSIDPIGQDGDDAQAGEEVSSGFVISGGDGAEIFEAAIGAFDEVAVFVEFGVEGEEPLAIGLVGDDRRGPATFEEAAQVVGIIAFVANQPGGWRGRRQERPGEGDVGDIAAAQPERERTAPGIDEDVDLGGAPTARAADFLVSLPPFAPPAARCALTAVLSIITTAGGSAHAASAAKIPCQMPRLLHLLYRLNTVVYGPYSSGTARQRQPSRKRWMMPLMMRRSSCRTGPV